MRVYVHARSELLQAAPADGWTAHAQASNSVAIRLKARPEVHSARSETS